MLTFPTVLCIDRTIAIQAEPTGSSSVGDATEMDKKYRTPYSDNVQPNPQIINQRQR
jgi:hypothetical protein